MPSTLPAPRRFSAVLFGLSGCLVDFGARTLPEAVRRLRPNLAGNLPGDCPPSAALGQVPVAGELQCLEQALAESAAAHAEATPGALARLAHLHAQGVPCAWLSELPADASRRLADPLPSWLPAAFSSRPRPWPAPDACWQALAGLEVDTLEGVVLVSGEPRLLQAGLNAGLWTVGLAVCGPLCGHGPGDWQALAPRARERLRADATLALYRLGVHSVIDHLDELAPGLDDLAARRLSGEKP
ncbi:MAG: HAD family phosphatase [Pseudomonas sp.]|uniref:HAD family phosphatase n=1 Tax=Pseudomonas sp. TaxID=306 RepID=UPI003394AAFB